MNKLQELLSQLSLYLGLEQPAENTDFATLEINGLPLDLIIDERSGDQELVIYSSLGTVPVNHELQAYRAFLEANLFWSGTGDGTLGVNSETHEAFIAYKVPEHLIDRLNNEGFIKLVSLFMEIVADWRNYIVSLIEAGTPLAPPQTHSNILKV